MPILNYFSVLFLLTLFFFPAGQLEAQSAAEPYCNVRYNFCAYYPEEVFSIAETSVNADGIKLSDLASDIHLEIAASYDVLDWDLRELFEEEVSTYNAAPDYQLINSEFTNLHFASVFRSNGQWVYLRTFKFDGILVSVLLKAPDTYDPAALDRINAAIYLTNNS